MTLAKVDQFKIHSNIRLPFDPKGKGLDLKHQIRDQIMTLKVRDSNGLYAALTTNTKDFFDVENVLFYNVGNGIFKDLNLDEIHFELIHSKGVEGYHYHYETREPRFLHGAEEPFIFQFSFPYDRIKTDHKPLYYWNLMHRGTISRGSQSLREPFFAIKVEITTTQRINNLASVIKPMIDGIISALHYQEGVDPQVLAHLGGEDGVAYFGKRDYSILGERNLISAYRKGVKWNPEDERCTQVRVIQTLGGVNQMVVSVQNVDEG